jgi:glycosyltransferase involved in cell wall biosynthesis
MKETPLISAIIRVKDEIRWIRRCLRATFLQDYPRIEIIIVENESSDGTEEAVREFECEIVPISDAEFSFGRALNRGIQAAQGDLIACLSSHCIPINNKWLDRLVINFESDRVAAVYGRQEPLPDTNIFDKRDLWNTFGLDRKVQVRDSFFHNANAMLRRSVWEEVPFDEELDGVEDRDWAKKVIETGYQIIYEPQASVYHHHGIHQAMDPNRAERVVRMIELINGREP